MSDEVWDRIPCTCVGRQKCDNCQGLAAYRAMEAERDELAAQLARARAYCQGHEREIKRLEALLATERERTQTDFEQLTLACHQRVAELNAQLATERAGAIAREEALSEAQWFARLAWEFIQASCIGDEIEADIGEDGSPEREMYLKWCIVRFAADDRPWLAAAPEEEPTTPPTNQTPEEET